MGKFTGLALMFALLGCSGSSPNILGDNKNKFGKPNICALKYSLFDMDSDPAGLKVVEDLKTLPRAAYRVVSSQFFAKWPPLTPRQPTSRKAPSVPVQIHTYQAFDLGRDGQKDRLAPIQSTPLCVSGVLPNEAYRAVFPTAKEIELTESGAVDALYGEA